MRAYAFLFISVVRGGDPNADPNAATAATVEETTTTTTTTQEPITAPPVGAMSKQLASTFTANSIRARMSDYGEDASRSRFNLQALLSASAGEKNASLAILNGLARRVKFETIKYGKKVDNITQILTADASAGGLQATSRSLMAQVPQAQKMLSKMMKQQLKNVAADGKIVKQLFQLTTDEYSSKMAKYGESLTTMIRNQDAAYARFASGQASAMKNSANMLKQSAQAGLVDSKLNLAQAVQSIANTGASAQNSLTKLTQGLSTVNGKISSTQSQFKGGLSDAKDDLQAYLMSMQDGAMNTLNFAADKSKTSIEGYAENAGAATNRQFESLDSVGKRLLGDVMVALSTNATKLSKTVDKTTREFSGKVDSLGNTVTRQVDSITGKSTTVSADNRNVFVDLMNMLGLEQSNANSIMAAFNTDMSGIGNGVGGSFSGVLDKAKGVASQVNSDSANELSRQNKYIQYLMEMAMKDAAVISGNAQGQLSQKERDHARQLAEKQARIDRNRLAVQQYMEQANRDGLNKAGAANDRINGATGTLSGSIADLFAIITDSSDSAASGLADMQSQFSSKSSAGFTNLIEALRGSNNDGTNTAEDFIRRIVGPSSDAANSQFGSMRDLLSKLLAGNQGQSDAQGDSMSKMQLLRRIFGQRVGGVGQSMNGIFALNSELANTVGNQGGTMLSDKRAAIVKALDEELAKAQAEAYNGVNVIDQLIHGTNGMNKFDNDQQVAQALGAVGSDMEAGNTDLVEVQKAQVKALTGLSSMAVSLLSQTNNQGAADSNTAKEMLAKNKASIIARFREIAANTTGTQLGDTMSALLATGNSTKILDYLTGDVQNALKEIEADANIARDVNNKKRSEFESYLSSVERDAKTSQAEIVAKLDTAIDSVQEALINETRDLNSTRGELEKGLGDIKGKVEVAQDTLRKNLLLYRDKLKDIIDQIRKYMNMSGDADELAIQGDISRQLAKVNSTEVTIASANAAVGAKIATQNKTRASASSSQNNILNSLIEGSMMTEAGATDAQLASNEKLVAVATEIDGGSSTLEESLSRSSQEITDGIGKSSAESASSMKRTEGQQAKILDQLSVKSGDVSNQARKAYIENLQRMRGVSDDTLMLSQQLATVLGGADSTIKDVTGSTMDHMGLSTETMAMLNKQAARKVASISDVMDAFTSVVLGFLNETTASMSSLKNDMRGIQNVSSIKLHQMTTRTADELNWVKSNFNRSQDTLSHIGTQNDAIRTAFNKGMNDVGTSLRTDQMKRDKANRNLVDQIDQMKQRVVKSSNNQLSKVRAWLRSRNPVIAQQVLASTSFVEVNPRT